MCSKAVNKQFQQGVAETRRGFRTPGWATQWGLSFPFDFHLKNWDPSFPWNDWYLPWTGRAHTLTGVRKVSDRGRTEFEFYQVQSYSWHYMPGDWMRVTGFSHAGFNGDFRASLWYILTADSANGAPDIDDRCLRVEVDAATWAAAPDSEVTAATLTTEGTANFDQQRGFGQVLGCGVFSDPNGQEGLLLATERGVWRLAQNQEPQRIDLPETVTLSGEVTFVQAFDRVLMLRGLDAAPLVWNPRQDFSAGLGAFEEIAASGAGSGDYTEPIPNATRGAELNGRVWLQTGRDTLAASEIFDWTLYDPVLSAFRINKGSDDQMTGILPFGGQRLLLFYDESVWALDNAGGDLTEISGDAISPRRGAMAPKAITVVGKDVWFLSAGGVWSLTQTTEGNLQAMAEPISAPMEPLFRRVNWAYAAGAAAAVHEERYYLALPIDGASWNNAIAVFNTATGTWEGYWQSAALDVLDFARVLHGGRRRLAIVNGANLTTSAWHGAVMIVGDGFSDAVCGTELEIADELLTRGYAGANMRGKAATADVAISTWRPSLNIAALADGVAEEQDLTGTVTRLRTRYATHGAADYDETNADDNHAAPYREDYSVAMPVVMKGDYAMNPGTARYLVLSVFGPMSPYSGMSKPRMQWTPGAISFLHTEGVTEIRGEDWPWEVLNQALPWGDNVISMDLFNQFSVREDGNFQLITTSGFTGVRGIELGEAGVNPHLHQRMQRRLRIRARGEFVQLRVSNTQGRCNVHGIAMEMTGGERGYRERL
jgi:hypothetical protein